MPKYAVTFTREYTITEGFSRVIEAPDAEAAQQVAFDLCSDFNQDCPDDCSEIDGAGSSDFEPGIVVPAPMHALVDYPIQGED